MMNDNSRIMLLWEGDDDFTFMFSHFLRKRGYQIDMVKSVDDCIETCKDKPPALLITRRLANSSNDGLEAIRKIRSYPDISYFPIVAGWADFPFANRELGYRETFEAGANACFGALFDMTGVLEEIEILTKAPMATEITDR